MTKLSTALYRAFRRIVIRLGRWFARRLATKGRVWLIKAMERKVRRLRGKLPCKPPWRERWIRSRIRIRLHAIRWLTANAQKLTNRVIDRLAQRAWELPYFGVTELPHTWARAN